MTTKPPRLVLYVDDDEDDRELITQTISDLDPTLQVIEAEDGLMALELLERAKAMEVLPCLIILDLNMPRMDGKRTLIEIKKDVVLRSLPVVIFSTFLEPKDQPFYHQHGVKLVTKPTTMTDIKKEVQNLLEQSVIG